MDKLIFIVVVFLAGFGMGWRVDSWQNDSILKVENDKQIEIERIKSRSIVADYQHSIDVQNASNRRIVALNNSNADLNNQLNRLRDTLNIFDQPRARETVAACDQRTATVESVFLGCVEKYSELASKADRHVEDIKTLTGVTGD